MLDTSHIMWTECVISPLHKKVMLMKLEITLRGIGLLSTFRKLFIRILDPCLTTWALDEYDGVDVGMFKYVLLTA